MRNSVFCSQVVNDLVFSGSSDQCVYTHNIHVSFLSVCVFLFCLLLLFVLLKTLRCL